MTKINDGENSKQNKTDGGTYGLADKISLKVLSSEKDPAEIRLIRQIFLKGSVAWVFEQNSPVPNLFSIANCAVNVQRRSKAHSALTASLVLHNTRIYKCAMKKNHLQWPKAD